ncbi:DUF406 family protein [Ferrimonas pelagia]|uniref:Uncharacterized protein n=1 Tax=Ferrimonas pelagia TaxID=1177826 RepID=A0ABP9EUD1_9GAMM
MENIEKNVSVDSDDGHVEIGTVIAEEDKVMSLAIEAKNEATARAPFQMLLAQAQAQCPEVSSTTQWRGKQLEIQLIFPTAAQRLTFEMSLA